MALRDNITSHQPTRLVITLMVAHWFTSDEAALIEFLVTHKAEVGDGFNFKSITWTAAVAHMVCEDRNDRSPKPSQRDEQMISINILYYNYTSVRMYCSVYSNKRSRRQ